MATKELNPKEWLSKVESRQKKLREKWLDKADKVVKIYEAEDCAEYPFNILYSNTETILPSVYNSTPRPEVSRRWTSLSEEDKKLDNAVSATVERSLEYFADTNQAEYETYSEAVKNAVRGWLVPGLGQARVKFHKEGNYEVVCFDSVSYDRFVWGYARTWKHVPWVAFGHDLQKAEFESSYPEFIRKEEYQKFDWRSIDKDGGSEEGGKEDKSKQGVLVWEIWDYASRKVRHVCDRWEGLLLEEDYPQKMTSRFPCPKPLMFLQKFKDLLPVPAYQMYEKQAEELNLLSRRIIKVERALRVRGFYSGGNQDLQDLIQQDDDTILAPTSEALLQEGIDKHIWMMPLDMLVGALRSMYEAREACKATIYEILGIGDILRGISDPNETAKAQQIKNNWGGLRIKKGQRDVQDFCLDLFRIAAEFSFSYCAPATFASITKLPYLFGQQKMMVQQQMQQFQMAQQQMQQQHQQMAQQAQAAGQQPPPPPQQQQPPVPPDMQRRASLPTWEEIVGVMQNSFERSYRVDIETNSTVDLESTEDKADMSEFMNAFGQMTAGFEKLLGSGQMPFEAFKEVMAEAFRRFRFGRKVQEALDMMQAPQPAANPDQIRKQVEQEMQAKVDKVQADGARQLLKLQEQLTRMSGDIEQLQTKLVQKDVEKQGEVQALRSDYAGKQLLQKEQHGRQMQQRDMQLLQAQMQQMFKDFAAQIQQTIIQAEHAGEKQEMELQQQQAQLEQQASMQQQGGQNAAV